MPERIVAERMRAVGASDADVRLLLTFAAAMDRARDADRLWFAAERLYESEPWAFAPEHVVERGLVQLGDVLREHKVTQRHLPDSAWRTIAESLVDGPPSVTTAVIDGQGDARELLAAVQTTSAAGTPLYPFLRGPKIRPCGCGCSPTWLAAIAALDVLPVAVDVQVRKVSEYLAMTNTGGRDLEEVRLVIQQAWKADIEEHGAVGPEPLDGTAGALDPALWFWGKWGCTRCERARGKLPIGRPCGGCRFPDGREAST